MGGCEQETYENGVRKPTYRDLDGNEIGFGDSPRSLEQAATDLANWQKIERMVARLQSLGDY
jgi:hypothetical protein